MHGYAKADHKGRDIFGPNWELRFSVLDTFVTDQFNYARDNWIFVSCVILNLEQGILSTAVLLIHGTFLTHDGSMWYPDITKNIYYYEKNYFLFRKDLTHAKKRISQKPVRRGR